ncbi:PREDICTED: uncharacterized protein LOC109465786 [Branchiostoma belcheri]|uniref:Uncharacterized protein LOC109465786 n=1 Tax=Branchiostoma belcheri TaxID=7741 RepID=A0A6P4Y2V7_BRABE|nr:PREDICTED: uncharacterized protein LOC109465786 [Branchiostoma belcheri]
MHLSVFSCAVVSMLCLVGVYRPAEGYPSWQEDDMDCLMSCETCLSMYEWPRHFDLASCYRQCERSYLPVRYSEWSVCELTLKMGDTKPSTPMGVFRGKRAAVWRGRYR